MKDLEDAVNAAVRESRFSGVVCVSARGVRVFERAYGFADRRHAVPMRLDTQLAIASGTKALTAVTTMSLIQDGLLTLGTSVRTLLGDDLPLVGDAVTVEHLLAHRSGIGDYLDEDEGLDRNAYLMPVPVHQLACTADYLPVLDGLLRSSRRGPASPTATRATSSWPWFLERATDAPFPRPGTRPGVPARRHARHRVPALRPATAAGRHRLPARRRGIAHQRVPPPSARQRRRRDLHHCRRPRLLLVGAAGRPDHRSRPRRGDDPTKQRRARPASAVSATGSASGSATTTTSSPSRGTTPGCRSAASTTRTSALTSTVISNTTDGAWPVTERSTTPSSPPRPAVLTGTPLKQR